MKRIHLLRATSPVADYVALTRELAGRGERLGWLDWRPGREPELEPDAAPVLDGACQPGVLRAVEVRRGRSVAVKTLRGAPVLADVVREHFRGCLAVLVASDGDLPESPGADANRRAPTVAVDGDELVVELGGHERRFSAAALADRLRRPRPFSAQE